MASKIVFNQDVTTQTGTLDDAVIDELVTLTNFDNAGVSAWRWVMLYKPPGSAATLTTPTAASSTFMPDVAGTYLVQLRTFADAAATELDAADTQGLGVPYLAPYPWRIPAAGETTQFDGDGWADEVNAILAEIRTSLIASGVTPANGFPFRPTPTELGTPVVTGTITSFVVSSIAGSTNGLVHDVILFRATDPQAGSHVVIPIAMPVSPLPDRFQVEVVFFTGAPPSANFQASLGFRAANTDLSWQILHSVETPSSVRPALLITELDGVVNGATWNMPDMDIGDALFTKVSVEKVSPFASPPQVSVSADTGDFLASEPIVSGRAIVAAPSSGSISAAWTGEDFVSAFIAISYENTIVGDQDLYVGVKFLPQEVG